MLLQLDKDTCKGMEDVRKIGGLIGLTPSHSHITYHQNGKQVK